MADLPPSPAARAAKQDFYTLPSNGSDSTSASRPTVVLIVIHILPLHFTKDEQTNEYHMEWNEDPENIMYRYLGRRGDDSDARSSAAGSNYAPKFIGCPHIYIPPEDEFKLEQVLLRDFNCVPVFLTPDLAHEHFQGFCQGVLWPCFHNILDVYSTAKISVDNDDVVVVGSPTTSKAQSPVRRTRSASVPNIISQRSGTSWKLPESWNPCSQTKCWNSYCTVNRVFSNKIVEEYHNDDVVWIHDYPLLMIPSYLIRRLPHATVAMFLHVPFPSSEIFRSLAMREDILRAVLCANHLSFVLFEHARHFFTACKRLLGIEYSSQAGGSLGINMNGRHVAVTCCHVATEPQWLESKLQSQTLPEAENIHSSRSSNNPIESSISNELQAIVDETQSRRARTIVSVDNLEGLSGIPLKLLAFEKYLQLHYRERTTSRTPNPDVVLIQIGLSTSESRPNDYHQTRHIVQELVDNINARWQGSGGGPVIVFLEMIHLSASSRLLLWTSGQVYLNTCIRLGLEMMPFEYIVTQATVNRGNSPGVAILSEFAAYARVLSGSLMINPWQIHKVAEALATAMSMTSTERQSRSVLDMKFIRKNAPSRWSEWMLQDIVTSGLNHAASKENSTTTLGYGFGYGYRVLNFSAEFQPLHEQEFVQKYAGAQRRLFIFFDPDDAQRRNSSGFDESEKVHPTPCEALTMVRQSSCGSVCG